MCWKSTRLSVPFVLGTMSQAPSAKVSGSQTGARACSEPRLLVGNHQPQTNKLKQLFISTHFLYYFLTATICHVPYFPGPSPSFSGLPATFPPVPDPFPCVFSYSHPFRLLPLSSDLPRHPSLPRFPSISVYIFVPTRFLSIFHIRIRP